MIIDILYALLLLVAVVKGFRRGLIVALFSFVALVIGLAAALKLSVLVAGYLGEQTNIAPQWLPFIAFLLVFAGVVILVKLGANALEEAVEVVMLGWLNKLGGIILYLALYTVLYSILLFYAAKMHWLSPETIRQSVLYETVAPIGPLVIDNLARLIPWFRDMFAELALFFDQLGKEIPAR